MCVCACVLCVQEERSQLSILMRTLKDDFAQLEEAKRVQEEENRALKDRCVRVGSSVIIPPMDY